MIDTNELRKAAKAVFLATEENVAEDLSDKLNEAARTIDVLRDEKSEITDATVEQSLLDNIDLTLIAVSPTTEDLSETHLAVMAYQEFQEALLVKSKLNLS